ncbi:MAG: cytochrome c [Rhodospirillaceae bacterium]|jgi:mono/diheme cytochrome c family protein|nr:cytochrome c [Rhodospirillaceae bacterium]
MSARSKSAGLLAVVLLTVSAVGIVLWPSADRVPPIDPGDRQQVALGEGIYRSHCASCHGAELEGQPNWRSRLPSGRLPAPPHDETGHTWHHPDEVLLSIVKQGPAFYQSLRVQTDMPAFGGVLSDVEIAAVLAFIKSRWPAEIRARQARTAR